MAPSNSYEDARRARAYADLEFSGTYALAYRDLPEILLGLAPSGAALDFGCGAGRSTRFLQALGFSVTGVDISEEMIREARARDPGGDYRLVREGDLERLPSGAFDLALSVFTFDNIPTRAGKVASLRALRRAVKPAGALVSVVSTPEIYIHEWASFSTKDFPENRSARSGGKVRIVITDLGDPRPVEDVLWSDADYLDTYREAGLACAATHRPLAGPEEPGPWINETRIPPWAIYVLRPAPGEPPQSES